MTEDEHLKGVGQVITNLWSLEHLLRLFLLDANSEERTFPKAVGESMDETHLTNYSTLDALISEYNSALDATEQEFRVDSAVVKLRDAMAHGRASAAKAAFPYTLYKLSRPDKAKKVTVEYLSVLNEQWFEDNTALVATQITNVVDCSKGRKVKVPGPV